MAVFRVERNRGYTVMSNHHLRNKELTLKAKGLLSQMLSLPEDWDYTLAGLSQINRESIDAIRTAVWELEKAGYIKRQQGRDAKGKMTAIEYTIYEQPQPPDDIPPGLDNPTLENPTPGNPILENPTPGKQTTENPMQLNKDIQKTDLPKKEKIITDEQSTHCIPILSPNPSPFDGEAATPPEQKRKEAEAQTAFEIYREIIKDNISYEKRKAEKRAFTARKKAGLLTPEELESEEKRLAHNREWQKEWREKRKAAEPPKPPKKKSIKELMELEKTGAELTPEEMERLAEHRQKKAAQHKAWRERQKAGQPKTRTLKELATAQKEGETLTPEETERLEAHRSRKKIAREKLVRQAETDPVAAAELAKKRAYQSEATKKSRQKMYAEAATGNPEAVERYENYLATRREAYHRKKQEITAEKTEQSA